MKYVDMMHVDVLRKNLERYEGNSVGYTPLKSVTVTGTVTVTRD